MICHRIRENIKYRFNKADKKELVELSIYQKSELSRYYLEIDILKGTIVDASEFSIDHFPNTREWPGTDEKTTLITGKIPKCEFPIQENWDSASRVGYHFKK